MAELLQVVGVMAVVDAAVSVTAAFLLQLLLRK